MKILARRANSQGNQLLETGNYQAAEEKFIQATKQAPNWSSPWYNLGLVYKRQKNWQQSFECNLKATQLDSRDEAAWWNLGIASTALMKWDTARHAWSNFGVKLPEGDGPLEMNLGPTPIRLNPDTSGEVVWCQRIDPARAIIRNVPFPSSEHRYGDLLLHDGEPNGYRQFQGREVAVFDELEILEESPFMTFEVVLEAGNEQDRKDLLDMAARKSLSFEDWSSVRMLCHLCSTGRPHADHEPQEQESGPLVRYGVAAQLESELQELLDSWQRVRRGCLILEVKLVYPDNS
ncbi:MAG: tetratricopeptide repeat protein [Anaerolineae bacterium]